MTWTLRSRGKRAGVRRSSNRGNSQKLIWTYEFCSRSEVQRQRRWRFSGQFLLKSDTPCLLRVAGAVSEWSELALKVWIWSVAVLVQITESPACPNRASPESRIIPRSAVKPPSVMHMWSQQFCVFVVPCSVSVRSGTKLASSAPLRPNSWNECQENTGYHSEWVAFPPEWNVKLGGLRTRSVMLNTCATVSSDSLWIATCTWCHICGALTDRGTTVSKIRNPFHFFFLRLKLHTTWESGQKSHHLAHGLQATNPAIISYHTT